MKAALQEDYYDGIECNELKQENKKSKETD